MEKKIIEFRKREDGNYEIKIAVLNIYEDKHIKMLQEFCSEPYDLTYADEDSIRAEIITPQGKSRLKELIEKGYTF